MLPFGFQPLVDTQVNIVEFLPDGKVLVAGNRFDNELKSGVSTRGRKLNLWSPMVVTISAFLPMAGGSLSVMVVMRFCGTLKSGGLSRPFPEHLITVHRPVFSTDGRLPVTACEARKLRAWNPDTGAHYEPLLGTRVPYGRWFFCLMVNH